MKLKSVSTKFTLRESIFNPLPALPVITLFLSVSVPMTMVEFGHFKTVSGGIIAVTLQIFLLIILPISIWKGFAWILLGFVITLLHIKAPWYDYTRHLPRSELYVEIEGVVADDRLIKNDNLEWIQEQKRFEFKLNKLRLSKHEKWQVCHGKILIINPNQPVEFRQKLRLKGRLVLPDESLIPGIFNYRNYLKIKKVKHIFIPNETISLGIDKRFMSRCLLFLNAARTRILYQLSKNVSNIDNKSILASLTFGIKSNFDRNSRANYLQSGMMHLFAISGLHVGILFTIIFFVLSLIGLPYEKKYFVSPLLSGIYVVMTGAAPSAVRAWLMLAIWSCGKGLKLPVVTLNTLLVSALVLLILNPFYILHSGFQFSYILVFCLVSGWNRGRELINYLNETRLWSVSSRQYNLFSIFTIRDCVLKSALSMVAVWLGSVGLSAFYNGLFLPTTILTNIVVCSFVWIIISISIIKVFLTIFIVQWPDYFIGKILSVNLDFIRFLSEISSEYGWVVTVEKPSILMILIYYFILFLLLSVPRNLKQFFFVALCLTGFVSIQGFSHNLFVHHPQIYVFLPRGSIVPCIVIIPEQFADEPIVLNSGNRRFGHHLTAFLESKGTTNVNKFILLDNRSDYYNGLYSISERFPINTLIICNSDRRNTLRLQRFGWVSNAKTRFYHKTQHVELIKTKIELDKTREVKRYTFKQWSGDRWIIDIDIAIRNNKGTYVEVSMTDLNTQLKMVKNLYFRYNNQNIIESIPHD